jgi:hypothetical protein
MPTDDKSPYRKFGGSNSRFRLGGENACSQQLTTALGIEEQTDPLGPNLHGIAPVSLASAESLVSIQ